MRVLVRGSGAIACVLAARLAPLAEVAVLTHWREQAEALARGLRLRDVAGVPTEHRIRTIDVPEPADVVILEVKCAGVKVACVELGATLDSARAVVALQNGIGGQEAAAEHVAAARFVPGVTYVAATLEAPGVVRQHSAAATVLADTAANHEAAVVVADLLAAAGFLVRRSAEWQQERWRKLVVTASVNGLSAILDRPLGALAESPAALALANALAAEVLAVARASGVEPDIGAVGPYLLERVRAGAGSLPSILQDLRAGRPTEVRYINGAVADLGERLGVPAPVNALVERLVNARSETTGRRTA